MPGDTCLLPLNIHLFQGLSRHSPLITEIHLFILKDSLNRQCRRKGGPADSKQKGVSTVTPRGRSPWDSHVCWLTGYLGLQRKSLGMGTGPKDSCVPAEPSVYRDQKMKSRREVLTLLGIPGCPLGFQAWCLITHPCLWQLTLLNYMFSF